MRISNHLLLAFILAGAAQTGAYAYSTSADNINALIPDGDLNGYQNSQDVSGLSGSVAHISVTLNISGGFNGDLYAYLMHDHVTAILLNRVGLTDGSGVGYPNSGFGPDAAASSFTLDDRASHDVHFYQSFTYALNTSGQLTGQWQPDGRAIDPELAGSAFDNAARSNPLSVFNGKDPDGPWTLYVADVSSGFESTLVGWSLVVDVPEPSTTALLLLCGAAALLVPRRGRWHMGC